MHKTLVSTVVMIFLLSGCGTWSTVGGDYKDGSMNLTVVFPMQWKRLKNTTDQIVITRDGLSLQQIRVARFGLDKELPNTKKKVTKEMLPQEVAGILIDDLNSDFDLANKQILENAPETIDGFQGFKFAYTFQTNSGLKKRAIAYGFVAGNWVYIISYAAPARHYFEKDIQTFEKIRETFKLINRDAT